MTQVSRQVIINLGGVPTLLDVDANIFGTGTVAQRPASGSQVGDLYVVQDAPLYAFDIWDGAAWVRTTIKGPSGGSVDNRIARWDGTTGAQLQNSGITISDADEVRHAGTVEWDKGADVASAATLVLGTDGNYFDITGTTTVTAVSAKPSGTRVVLQFDGVVTVTHNATTLALSGGVNLTTAAGDHLELVSYDGTNWREVSRGTAPGVGSGDVTAAAVLADNALVRGDGGAKGVQDSGVTVSDADEVRHAGTVELSKGADLASVAALPLGTDGNYFFVTGTTTITSVSVKPSGTRVLLKFSAVLTVTHHATSLILATGVDFVTAAGDVLELVSDDGTNWREVGRTVNAGLGGGGMDLGPLPNDPTPGPFTEGDTYYNTGLHMQMTYDASRSKWLSVDADVLNFGRNGATGTGSYYRASDGLAYSTVNGRNAEFNGTIVSLSYTRKDTDTATFEITADGAAIATVVSAALTANDTTLDGDFSAGDILGARNQSGGNTTSRVHGWARIRWRDS